MTTEHVDVTDPAFVRHYTERTGFPPIPGAPLDPSGVNFARFRIASDAIARARTMGGFGVFPTPGRPGEWTPIHEGAEFESHSDASVAHAIAADGSTAFSARREATALSAEVKALRDYTARLRSHAETLKDRLDGLRRKARASGVEDTPFTDEEIPHE